MISAALFKTLDAAERKLWHSHVFEVKSGMLIMPGPDGLPTGIWEAAETKEMEQVVGLYGKTYHFWQIDRGDKLPLGEPQLMMSFTKADQQPGLKELMKDRDSRFRVNHEQKAEKREYIREPEIHDGNSPQMNAVFRVTGTDSLVSLQMQTVRGRLDETERFRKRAKSHVHSSIVCNCTLQFPSIKLKARRRAHGRAEWGSKESYHH